MKQFLRLFHSKKNLKTKKKQRTTTNLYIILLYDMNVDFFFKLWGRLPIIRKENVTFQHCAR